jgi:hypothetical protein
MSLFGSNTTVTYGSVVYNLAGPVDKRPNYLKTTMIAAVLNDAPSIPDVIRNSYMSGPGVTLRSFTNWAETSGLNTAIGLDNSTLTLGQSVDQAALVPLISHPVGQTVALQVASIGFADYVQWADRFVAQNYPALFGTAYTSAIDNTTNVITVTFADTTTTSFTATNYHPSGVYLYACYCFITPPSTGPLVTGTTVTLSTGGMMPSTSGWTLDSSSGSVSVWERTTYQGMNFAGTAVTSLREVMTQTSTPSPGSYRIDTQVLTGQLTSPITVLIYEKGSGNTAMDALFVTSTSGGGFFPFLPIRLGSQFIGTGFKPDIYALGKKALKKAVNGNLDKVIAGVADNSSLSHIEDAFIVFGVALNTQNNSSKKYIYDFFKEALLGQDLSGGDYLAWQIAWDAADASAKQYPIWALAQNDPHDPLFGSPEPDVLAYPAPPTSSVKVSSDGTTGINYSSTIFWDAVVETTGTGLKIPSAVPGQLWFDVVEPRIITATLSSAALEAASTDFLSSVQRVRLNWQVDATHWKSLDIYGLYHSRVIHRGDSIITLGVDALGGTAESEFIVPMHNGIFSRMPMVDVTQMSTSCAFIVFTTAVITRTPWYATGAFKIFIIIAVIIIAVVVTVYTGGAATPGLLGTAGSVGTTLGATGTAAIILGAVVNTIAALVLTQIITSTSTAVFGPKIGNAIGLIASLVIVGGLTSYMSGVSLASNFSGLALITNLAKLTMAVGNGIAAYMEGSTQDIIKKTQELMTSYNQDSLEIQQQSTALLGSDNGIIDALTYSDVNQTNARGMQLTSVSDTASSASAIESLDVFLSRTLLTGSDLAGLSLDMIGNFTKLTLDSDLPI